MQTYLRRAAGGFLVGLRHPAGHGGKGPPISYRAVAIEFLPFSRNRFRGAVFLKRTLAKREPAMSPTIAVPESRRCRTRAVECRTMAELFRVQIARDQMLKAAADYERMARDAEQREIAQGISYLRALATSRQPAR